MIELTPEARALTRAVREAERPEPGARQRIRGHLFGAIAAGTSLGTLPAAAATQAATGASVAAAGGAASSGATALTLSTGKIALWALLGLGGGTAVTATAYTVQSVWEPRTPSTAGAPVAASASSAVARAPEPAPVAVVPAPRPSAVEMAPPAVPAARPPAVASTLVEERQLIQQAQIALRDGQPARALIVLEEHARRFPVGILAEERRAARVLALCRQGRLEAAREEAGRLTEESPSSPLIPSVRRSCAFDE